MKLKVLVVGGAGYIGGGTTEELMKRKIPFSVYDNLTYENHYLKPVEFIYGDIRDHSKLKQILPNYSHVIWLAGLVGDPACQLNPQLTKEINQDSVEWISNNFDGRILFTSTCSVYGASDDPVNESSKTNPLSAYAQTKLNSENFLKDKDALIFRLGTAFGISDTYSRIRMDLAVNIMTMNAIKKGALTVFGGSQWRPFVHVNDIAQFLVDNLDRDVKGIYNIATENTTIVDLAKRIQEETGCKIETTEEKFQDNRNYNADQSKALKDKVIPKTTERTLLHGIKQVKDLVNENRVVNLENEFYSNVKRMTTILEDYENNNIKQ
ncbi:MAG: NAD-dependent epimerase/dehydratase family protein [Candidatus Kerfeldbacteria bacterium]